MSPGSNITVYFSPPDAAGQRFTLVCEDCASVITEGLLRDSETRAALELVLRSMTCACPTPTVDSRRHGIYVGGTNTGMIAGTVHGDMVMRTDR